MALIKTNLSKTNLYVYTLSELSDAFAGTQKTSVVVLNGLAITSMLSGHSTVGA